MPKKKKAGSRGSSPDEKSEEMAASSWAEQSEQATQPQDPLHPNTEQERIFLQVQEMFKNKVDGDVIFMVLSECDWKGEILEYSSVNQC
mgnify:CR=1 FL=1